MSRRLQRVGPASRGAALGALTAMGILGGKVSTVLAQFQEQGPPQLPDKPPTWAWVIGGLFLAACLVVAFKNPKRSHLN
jgi:hypothetical protein